MHSLTSMLLLLCGNKKKYIYRLLAVWGYRNITSSTHAEVIKSVSGKSAFLKRHKKRHNMSQPIREREKALIRSSL